MKKGILLSVILVSTLFGQHSIAQELFSGPAISVDKETHEYGTLAYGSNSECVFTVTNIGTEPLIITKAQPSCGCTQPIFSSEPIAPGESATIKVSYDTNRVGDFTKSITLMSNAVNEGTKIIYIKGTVSPKPEGAAPIAPTTSPAVDPAKPVTPSAPANGRPSNGSATLTTPKP
jgi:hypothetical protein